MKYCFWLLAFLLCASVAFAQKAKPRKARNSLSTSQKLAAPVSATEPVLIVQRTPCHGTCPTYTATIFADGRVEYEGERFVALLGKHTLHLPVATVNQLLAEAKRINFTKFESQYGGNSYDLPSTIITVHPAGQPAKVVTARGDVPAALEGYVALLAQQLDPLANGGAGK